MQVFIENEAGSDQKHIFNEKTFEYKKTYTVSANYPYPYGFIPNTTSGDGDNLDCFVLTNKPLKSRDVVEVEPIGMFEQIEDGEEDYKILAVLIGETWKVNEETERILRDFGQNVFSHIPGKNLIIRRFLGVHDALKLIESVKD